MASINPPPTSGDELDDILSGITAEGGHVQSQTKPATSKTTTNNNTDGDLGIDEEIVVTKKRISIPKLDDVRLRSEPGIPRLRKISKERLRFKGKGHEYGDIARMLNMYQLWLDDLYPRAKFADALAIIEKVGHTKRMQVDRKAWIDEGSPRHTTEQDDDLDAHVPDEAPAQSQEATIEGFESGGNAAGTQAGSEAPNQAHDQSHAATEEPDEDELDALLAESAEPDVSRPKALPSRSASARDDPFADEMEAMEGMEDMW
ncbi:Swi3-domain-containing protein [Macroventuria anomochaeta]|uniref:Swi3-domain-containing protein n=1 Tax=Macroventuria anomochaeta TaxID=301207 RepID=A0ACB6SHV8_9PLEO|nr:Swi3-domain-containing protein [Macroventuria anomochaeta]KAF2633619.1 Swi3-domain-containing protein [Macroventuria anomochaeta]